MKIDSLFENVTPSSSPAGLQSQQAPKFGRDPNVLEDDKLDETTAGATGSGAVASVSQPMGTIQKRKGSGALLRGISTSEKYPNSKAVKEAEIVEQDIIINPSMLSGPKPGFHNKIDMEGDTVKNSLHTIVRVADDLNDRIENHTQFPEWVSEKIGAIKSMMVNVMDYVISQQERGDDHVIDEFAQGDGGDNDRMITWEQLVNYINRTLSSFGFETRTDKNYAEFMRGNEGLTLEYDPSDAGWFGWAIGTSGVGGKFDVSHSGTDPLTVDSAEDVLEYVNRVFGYKRKGVAEGSNPAGVVVKISGREYAAMSPEQKDAKQREWQRLKQQAKKRLQTFTIVDTDKEQGVAEGIYVPEIPRAPQPKPDPKNKTVDEDWQKVNRKDKTSGMSKKAVKAYRRENPGSKLQTAVTTKPSKLKKGSKSAKRRKSFCARMKGMKKAHAGAKTKRNPDSPINKALRRWNCESIEEMQHLIMVAEQQINELKDTKQIEENLHKWFKEKWVRFGPDGKIRGDCARGDDSEGKPKCLPQSKAHSLGKKGRASAAARKRREDPNPERSGKAINVATKKKTNETNLDEKWSEKYKKSIDCSNPKGFSQRAHCQGRKKNEDQQLDEKCWDTHKQVGMKKKGSRMVPNCVPKESVNEEQNLCPHCGGLMYEMSMMNEKKDACYYKVKSRYKVWPSAYASGALVKCRKKGAKNWGTKSEGVETDQQPQQDSQPQKQTTPDYLNTIKNVGTAALALKDKNLADLLKQELYQMLYNKTSGEPNR